MKSVEDYMRAESEARSPCRVVITRLKKTGEFHARMIFAPGMEKAHGVGMTVADALERLENNLNFGA